MKKQPTKKQWNEITREQKIYFWSKFLKKDEQICITDGEELAIPVIGQLIEFLRDDLKQIDTTDYEKASNFTLFRADKKILGHNKFSIILKDWKYIIDALWSAVKSKL